MSDDEVDELLKAVDTSSGEINYVGMLQAPLLILPQTETYTEPDLVRTILAN